MKSISQPVYPKATTAIMSISLLSNVKNKKFSVDYIKPNFSEIFIKYRYNLLHNKHIFLNTTKMLFAYMRDLLSGKENEFNLYIGIKQV